PLSVASFHRELKDLRGDPQTLLGIVRPPRRGEPTRECVRECRWVSDPARDLDGVLAEPVQVVRRSLVPLRSGEPRHQFGPYRAVAGGQGSQRSLEERDQPPIAAGASPDEPAAVPEGRGGE